MECKIAKNAQSCTCSYESCSKRGLCCECVAYHRSKKEIPGCFFTPQTEKTWDRSIENFVNTSK